MWEKKLLTVLCKEIFLSVSEYWTFVASQSVSKIVAT